MDNYVSSMMYYMVRFVKLQYQEMSTRSLFFFFVICLFFLQQNNTVLRIHYVQSLNLQKALQYLQYITYNYLLTIHVTILTIYIYIL